MSVGKATPFIIGRISDGKLLLFDGVTSESYTQDINVPTHVVEGDGRSIIDHQQPGLKNAAVEAEITETPLAHSLGVSTFGAGEQRCLAAVAFMEACVKGLLFVQFSRGQQANMILTSLTVRFPNTRKVQFGMTFRRPEFAEAVSVAIAARRIPPKAPRADVSAGICTPDQTGPQTPWESETSEPESRSTLYGALLAAGIRDP